MKQITFVLLRHGKNVPELGNTLTSQELTRAADTGNNLTQWIKGLDYVGYSPLPRAIQTALAVCSGIGGSQIPLEAEPAFGNDALFKEMTAPKGFRERAKEIGNFAALCEFHPSEKKGDWTASMMNAVEQIFEEVKNGSVVLLCLHSPTIEMILYSMMDGMITEEYQRIAELDAVVVSASYDLGDVFVHYVIERKIPAATIEPPKQVVTLETGGLDADLESVRLSRERVGELPPMRPPR